MSAPTTAARKWRCASDNLRTTQSPMASMNAHAPAVVCHGSRAAVKEVMDRPVALTSIVSRTSWAPRVYPAVSVIDRLDKPARSERLLSEYPYMYGCGLETHQERCRLRLRAGSVGEGRSRRARAVTKIRPDPTPARNDGSRWQELAQEPAKNLACFRGVALFVCVGAGSFPSLEVSLRDQRLTRGHHIGRFRVHTYRTEGAIRPRLVGRQRSLKSPRRLCP